MPRAKKKPAKTAAKKKAAKPKAPPPQVRRKPDGRRWYTDAERIGVLSALKANGGNVAMTAKEQGVPYLTLWCWAQGRRCPEALQMQSDYDGKMADSLAEIAWQACAIIPQKMDKAPLNYLTGLLDKSIEKMRLLRGQSTAFGQTANTNVNLPLDPSRLNEQERAIFVGLLAKLRGTDADGSGGGGLQQEEPGAGVPREIPHVLT